MCEKPNIQSTEWEMYECSVSVLLLCDFACSFVWFDLLIAWNWVKFSLLYMQFNTTIVYNNRPLLLPTSSSSLLGISVHHHQFLSSKVRTRVSFYQHIQSTHRDCFIRVLLHICCIVSDRQNKELGVGDYIYYTQIFDSVNAVAKRGFWCCCCCCVCYYSCGLFIWIPPSLSLDSPPKKCLLPMS